MATTIINLFRNRSCRQYCHHCDTSLRLSDILDQLTLHDHALARIEAALRNLITSEDKEMKELDALQAAVAKNTEVVAAAIAAINAKAGVDPLKLVALTTEITADSTTLEAALAASAPKNGEPPVI